MGYSKQFYILGDNYNNNNNLKDKNTDISIVNQIHVAVDQAKSAVKNENTINRAKKRKFNQMGGSSGKKKSTKSKKMVVKKKKKKSQTWSEEKQNKTKTNKRGKVKKTKKSGLKSYSSIWM